MDSLLQIQKVDPIDAEIHDPLWLRIIHNSKGRSVFLNSTKSIETVAFLEFMPGGEPRGNHYHLHKNEMLYILEGKVILYYWLPSEPEVKQTMLEGGHLVTIKPNLCHAYIALERTLAFEVGTQPYDAADTIYDYRIEEKLEKNI